MGWMRDGKGYSLPNERANFSPVSTSTVDFRKEFR